VPDGEVKIKPRGLLFTTSEEDWVNYRDYLDDSGYLTAGHGGLLVERGDQAC
jgi:hypothetical protein